MTRLSSSGKRRSSVPLSRSGSRGRSLSLAERSLEARGYSLSDRLSVGALTLFSYLALVLSSNHLIACQGGESRPQSVRVDPPRILAPRRPDAGVIDAPGAPTRSVSHRDHFGYCYGNYTTSGNPSLDLLRLGALCGPSNGMLAVQPRWNPRPQDADPELGIAVEAGDCLRVIAASASGAPFELEWRDGNELLVSCEQTHFGLCPADGVVCPSRSTSLTLGVHSDGPLDRFSAEVWRLPGLP
ncbi:MAG: hypothetical protein RJA70_2687 [Pseudomonadota bacterium]|jgi:hypothetical protein